MRVQLLFIAFFSFSLVAYSQSGTKKMTSIKFTEYYLKKFSQEIPEIKYELSDSLEFIVEKGEHKIRHNLTNAYLQYSNTPEELEDIINQHLTSSIEIYKDLDNNNIDKSRIIPVIKHLSYLQYLQEIQKTNEINLVFENYNQELIIIYGEDTETSVRYFDKDDFGKLNIGRDTLLDFAKRNLINILPNIEKHGDNELAMIVAGGDFEVCLILLDIWDKETFPVKGEIVIGIPNKDVLIVTGSQNKKGIKKMKKIIAGTHSSSSYPISNKLFIRSGEKFEIWE